MRVRSILSCVATLALAAGCATVQPPADSIARAEQAIRKADEAMASQHAPLQLVKAREKLDKARVAEREDEWETARRLAEEALADAQLAEEKARAARAETAAAEMKKTVESLRVESRSER